MLYRILKVLMRIGINLYYSEIKVRNERYLEHTGPMIIIANHPNTLVDALLIGIISPRPIYYMTKATFFNNKLKMRILRSLNMIPVNRATEAKTQGVDNSSTLEECYRLLAEGKTLVIFPEGNSQMELLLRQLKSGAARIALESELRGNGTLNLKVVPVGLMYTQGEKFRSSIMVNFGNGIGVTHYLEEFRENQSSAARKLTEEFRKLLEGVLVTTQNKEQEALVTALSDALKSRYLHNASDVESEVGFMKKIRDRIEVLTLEKPKKVEQIQQLLWNLNWKTQKLEIKNDFLDRGLRSSMFIRQIITSFIGLIIGFPVYLFGLIHNILPFKFTDFIIPKITKSKEFYAPLAILIGLIIYPLNYAFFAILFYQLFQPELWLLVVYCVLMPVLGFFAYNFSKYMQHISYKLNYIFLLMNKKEVILEMKEQRKQLFQLIFED
ncbi:MAG: 1-acyl-sn-glycerol-3-phosphate acyltransferase [Crocinitomicaceae bacterium]|nr:1-acyl-sn-glycerol-3-phosphate acyltransferase [Crocinitomicaceae bacterium]